MKNKIEYFEFTVGEEIPQEVIDGKMKINNRLAIRGVLFYQNKLLMIQTSKGDYKFPGGGKEENESDYQTLNREYQEETGFVNLIQDESKIKLIGKTFTQNVDTEKEIVLSVVEKEIAVKIMEQVKEKVGVGTAAHGLCFFMPVEMSTLAIGE